MKSKKDIISCDNDLTSKTNVFPIKPFRTSTVKLFMRAQESYRAFLKCFVEYENKNCIVNVYIFLTIRF